MRVCYSTCVTHKRRRENIFEMWKMKMAENFPSEPGERK